MADSDGGPTDAMAAARAARSQETGVPRRAPNSRADPATPRVDPQRWIAYFAALDQGYGKAEAARSAGISPHTAYAVHNNPLKSSGVEFYKQWLQSSKRDVVDLANVSALPRRALKDFELFRKRYFGHISLPWHVKAAEIISEKLRSPDKEFLVINCPPGSGKSTLMTHDTIVWELVKNRSLRVMIGTRAASTGADYVQRIKNSFDRVLPVEADENDVALGLACDAAATLLGDYGRFKPVDTGYWRGDQIVLARAGGVPAHQKESSVRAWGEKSGFLGGRYNLVVWDDVVTDANSRTSTQQAELARWWRTTAESRLEPGGLLVLMGQRMSAHDLYRYAIDQRDVTDFVDMDIEDIDVEDLPRKYHHICFAAHDEAKCKGSTVKRRTASGRYRDAANPDHKQTGKPWPKGCLLDPVRLTWRELRVAQYNDPRAYATIYQQQDTDAESVLVNPLWIKGGEDPVTGVNHPGCWDTERHLGVAPVDLAGQVFSVITADPSPAQFWGIMWWLYQCDTDFHHLIDLERRRMKVEDFLHRNHDTGRFSGLLETWWQAGKDIGRPVTHVIVETNAAQKYLLQYDSIIRWAQQRGVSMVPHDTKHYNKADANYGVTALAPHYRHGKTRLPGHWASRKPVMALYDEVTRYPDAATDDLVMSQWFLLWQAPRLFQRRVVAPVGFDRPSWLATRRRGIAS